MEDDDMKQTKANHTRPWAGAGTWPGEAQRVRLLAAEVGIILDEESLVYYDIREVMALGLRLQRAHRPNCGRLRYLLIRCRLRSAA
jgi:hypothetical protein